jgi:hypothetical protein
LRNRHILSNLGEILRRLVFLIVATIAGIRRQSDRPPEVEKAIGICR